AFSRQEWEWEISGNKPDVDLAGDTALAKFDLKKLKHRLRPVFETDVERATLPVHQHGNDLEIAIDQGEIRAGRRREPISEIEIEVKKGDPVELVKFARRLAGEFAVGYGAKTKAERGYTLASDKQHQPVFAGKIILNPTMSAAQAFQAI